MLHVQMLEILTLRDMLYLLTLKPISSKIFEFSQIVQNEDRKQVFSKHGLSVTDNFYLSKEFDETKLALLKKCTVYDFEISLICYKCITNPFQIEKAFKKSKSTFTCMHM